MSNSSRYLFYAAIFSLVCFINILVFHDSGTAPINNEIKTFPVTDFKPDPPRQNAENLQIPLFSIEKRNFTCGDQIISVVWKHLRKEAYFPDTRQEIEDKGIKTCEEVFNVSEIDLNEDRKSDEVIVRAKAGMPLCGATGNCSMWVLRKVGKKYKMILDAGSVEEMKPSESKTGTYFDLETRYRFGGGEYYLGDYRFDGKKYRLKRCTKEITWIEKEKHLEPQKLSDCK